MKSAIGLLVVLVVTQQAVCDSGVNTTASNETISSNTEKPIIKKITDFFKGAFKAGRKSDPPLKEGNSTLISPTHNSSADNTTEEQPANRSAGITAATGTTKSPDATSKTTKASEREGEFHKTTLIAKENSTTEGSFKSNATEEESTGDSVVSESALDTTPPPERPGLQEAGENASNPNITDDAAPSAPNEEEDELNKTTSEAKENSTAEESLIGSDTQGHSDGDSVVSESAPNETPEPAERDLRIEGGDDSNPNTVEDESLVDEDSTLPEPQTDGDTGNVSEFELKPENHEEYCIVYINQLVGATLTEHKDQLDPLILRDMKMVFSAPFLLSSVKGQVGFYDGKVIGLSQGIPTDKCKVEERGDQVRLKSGIYIEEALIMYKGRVTLLDFGPKINVGVKLSGITADLHLIVPKAGGIGKLESFRVGKIKRTEIEIEGLGIVDWSAEFITEQTTEVFTLVFRRSIEREFRKALEDQIVKINYM